MRNKTPNPGKPSAVGKIIRQLEAADEAKPKSSKGHPRKRRSRPSPPRFGDHIKR